MNGRKLQDRLYLGMGLSARNIGQPADAFRPTGPFHPLAKENRFLRLPVTFASSSGKGNRTNDYGAPLWYGVFDASYTRSGDYLVTASGVFFIASQAPLLPVLCVKTNRTISFARPNMQTGIASNAYGGYTSGGSIILMGDWPASVLGEGKTSHSAIDLPTAQLLPYWNVLVPSSVGIVLSPSDIITDDLGRTAVVVGSELTDLGWRISARMATT
jgi:hypothetical protein